MKPHPQPDFQRIVDKARELSLCLFDARLFFSHKRLFSAAVGFQKHKNETWLGEQISKSLQDNIKLRVWGTVR